ncbi:vitelline membrane outer layer protein 1 homolog isoform X1 [Balaenoptera musculus]|uniref:Vitelline membrane outer layer protein 1 homolog isoform X1 n=1 Tax=Balaenoptera musculus TaxID=9771 RepID=A0A8B8W2K1_BALMU|nr:vitelline membrane outer layer protein 1 homolog isoform X1 [Balaenoptera musculus]
MEQGAGAKLLLLLWATCFGRARADALSGYTLVIEVTNGGPWGDWAWPEMCPDGFFASGFSLKVEPPPRHSWRRHGSERNPAALRARECGAQHARGGVPVWKVGRVE